MVKLLKRTHVLTLILLLFLNARSWGENPRPGVEGFRKNVKNEFLWVGKIRTNGAFRCSVWILKHGLAVTARHCFRNNKTEGIDMIFGEIASAPAIVKPEQIYRFQFDSGSNDLAYVIYDAAATSGKIAINHTYSLAPIQANTPIYVVGFPSPRFNRVLSSECRATGFIGTFPPHPKDAGYIGEFIDTTCAAWYGVSGGAVFTLDSSSNTIVLVGVLTHTFDINEDGSVDEKFLQSDPIGTMTTSMFSPLSLSRDLAQLLNEIEP